MLFKGEGYVMHEGKVYQFVDGVLDVKDIGLIEKMKKYYEFEIEGFEDETVDEEIEAGIEVEVDYENMTNSELKAILDNKKVSYSNKANKNDLIKLILGVD